jgi:Porin subfamily
MKNRWHQTHMIQTSRFVPVFGGAAAICFAFGVTSASASDTCAAYGPGFTKVDGSETCIHIGGHVRVEAGPRLSSSTANNGSGLVSNGARPASLHSGPDDTTNSINAAGFGRSHVRLPQGALGYADPQ